MRTSNDLKGERIILRVNEETYKYLKDNAIKKGITVSEYVREILKKSMSMR